MEAEVRRHLEFDEGRDGANPSEDRCGPLRTDELLTELRKWKVTRKRSMHAASAVPRTQPAHAVQLIKLLEATDMMLHVHHLSQLPLLYICFTRMCSQMENAMKMLQAEARLKSCEAQSDELKVGDVIGGSDCDRLVIDP